MTTIYPSLKNVSSFNNFSVGDVVVFKSSPDLLQSQYKNTVFVIRAITGPFYFQEVPMYRAHCVSQSLLKKKPISEAVKDEIIFIIDYDVLEHYSTPADNNSKEITVRPKRKYIRKIQKR